MTALKLGDRVRVKDCPSPWSGKTGTIIKALSGAFVIVRFDHQTIGCFSLYDLRRAVAA